MGKATMKNLSAYTSGMRGPEKRTYHSAQAPTNEENQSVNEQAGAAVGGVTETPKVFSSGMRGSEKPKAAADPLEDEVSKKKPTASSLGLPAGSEIIGSDKTHHTVRIPIGAGTTKAAK